MCGVAGIVGNRVGRRELEAMVASQHHRGPDVQGTYSDPDDLAWLGHNRLSIIDLSWVDRQPMASADGHFWIVLNGEIYNYRELHAESRDDPFRSRTDTEVIQGAEKAVDRA